MGESELITLLIIRIVLWQGKRYLAADGSTRLISAIGVSQILEATAVILSKTAFGGLSSMP